MKRWLLGMVVLVGLALAARLLLRFPWSATGSALLAVSPSLLVAATVVNLVSPLTKGWAWHLLLGRVARHRWRTAQKATFVGAAVNSIGVGVTGEAARVALIVAEDGVSVRAATLAVAWVIAVEGIGLALFLAVGPTLVRLPAAVRGLQLGAAAGIVTVFALSRYTGWARLIAHLPRGLRAPAIEFARMGVGVRLVAPIALILVNWIAQWMTYLLALRAAAPSVSVAAAFTAVLAVNLGTIGRLTPGNVGVTQAAVVGALVVFGVPADRALAGSLALQAVQVLPILGIAAALVGWTEMRHSIRRRVEAEDGSGEVRSACHDAA